MSWWHILAMYPVGICWHELVICIDHVPLSLGICWHELVTCIDHVPLSLGICWHDLVTCIDHVPLSLGICWHDLVTHWPCTSVCRNWRGSTTTTTMVHWTQPMASRCLRRSSRQTILPKKMTRWLWPVWQTMMSRPSYGCPRTSG